MQPGGCFIYARVASLPLTCHLHPSTRLPYNRAGPVSQSWYLFQPRPHVSLGNTRALISTPRNSLLFKIYFERGYSVPDIMLQRVKSWKRQFQNCMIPHTPRSLLWQGSSNLMLITFLSIFVNAINYLVRRRELVFSAIRLFNESANVWMNQLIGEVTHAL